MTDLSCGHLWSLIFDVTVVTVWGLHELCLRKMANLLNVCVFWLLRQLQVPLSHSLSLGLSIPWDTQYWN